MNTTTQELPLALNSVFVGDHRSQLHRHLDRCRTALGSSHRLHCMFEAVYEAVAPRLVTTAAVVLAVAVLFKQFVW